jgi:hypothetical protein
MGYFQGQQVNLPEGNGWISQFLTIGHPNKLAISAC